MSSAKKPLRRGDPPGKRDYKSRELPQRLRHARLVLSVNRGTQVSAADIANVIGVAGNTIARYEGGKLSEPSLPMIEALAAALEVNAAWLAFGEGEMAATAPVAKAALKRAATMPIVPARTPAQLRAERAAAEKKRG